MQDIRLKRRIRIVGFVLLFAGLAGFFFPLAYSLGGCSWIPNSAALPLSTVDSFAVDSRGDIYCGLAAYARIQQYSPDGRFVRGWNIDTSGGTFWLRIENGQLLVQTARTDLRYVFNLNGQLLSKTSNDSNPDDSWGGPHNDGAGNEYSVANPDLFPRLVRTTPSGERTVLASVPIYLWSLSGPLPGWLTIIAGIMLITNLGKSPRI